MPIYEYRCLKCREVFEAFQKINDKPLKDCKFCNSKVERLISQSSFHLKGSGWYLSDYSRKSGAPSESTDSGAKTSDKTTKSKDSGSSSTE